MAIKFIHHLVTRQGNGCVVYETFFVNFWVIILCPVFVHQNLKTLFVKKPRFLSALPVRCPETEGYYTLLGQLVGPHFDVCIQFST